MRTYPVIPAARLPRWEAPPAEVESLYREALKGFGRKIIVLDDDPTGIQTVHGISVYTDWSEESLLECFRDGASTSFILTNSRSFAKARTAAVHREIAQRVLAAAERTGRDFVLISRGDSTLRGHWPLETQVLAQTLAESGARPFDGEILLPFFPEGGRFTFGGVHYVQEGEHLIPAGLTEFAKDAAFGYSASHLADWCQEKTDGSCRAEDCIHISLEALRKMDIEGVCGQLLAAEHFCKIIVDAACYEDLKLFCAAYVKALGRGKRFLFRTAAAWVRILGGISARPMLTHEELAGDSARGGMVLVGSYVQKTTAQLECLQNSGLPLRFFEFHAERIQEANGLEDEAARIAAAAEELVGQGVSVVVYTSRRHAARSGMGREETLQMSVAISEAVTGIVGRLQKAPAFIVAKGGITSSDVGVKGLRVKKALVMGQIMPGIPVWLTGDDSKFPQMPYVIFPGNVGDRETLRRVVSILLGKA